MITPDPEPMTTLGTPPPFGRITLGLLWATLGKPPLLTDYFRITFGLLYKRSRKGTVGLYSKSV